MQQKTKIRKKQRSAQNLPSEKEIARLYKAGKLKFKTFENAEDFIKYLRGGHKSTYNFTS